MRGKDELVKPRIQSLGITPAHAGKSICTILAGFVPWDHPRACGEKNGCVPQMR